MSDKRHYGNGSRSNSHRRSALWSFLFGSTSAPGVCFWCERHLYFDRSTFDHVPPLSKGGHLDRGVISCYSCNHERRNRYDPVRDKIPDYLLAMRERLEEERIIEKEERIIEKEERIIEKEERRKQRRHDYLLIVEKMQKEKKIADEKGHLEREERRREERVAAKGLDKLWEIFLPLQPS